MINYDVSHDFFVPGEINVKANVPEASLREFKTRVCSTCVFRFMAIELDNKLHCAHQYSESDGVTPCRDPEVIEELGIRIQ